MFKTLVNVFRIAELRNKVLFTLALLCVYRVGFYVPMPGVDAAAMVQRAKSGAGDSALGVIASYLSIFSGGDLGQSTIFGLGIMPYISASIILQLLATVLPALEKLRKEGEPGMRKINEWTRYLTVGVCLIQSALWLKYLTSVDGGQLLLPFVRQSGQTMTLFWIISLLTLTGGSIFLMWLGEQIDQYGIGNGVSLIITAGIVSRMPTAVLALVKGSPFADFGANWEQQGFLKALQASFMQGGDKPYSILTILFIVVAFVVVVAGSILLTQAQRRIRIQQAKHMRGRRVYGGDSQYLPLRVNHAGVMPIIFASSLMVFPSWITQLIMPHLLGGASGGQLSITRQIIVNLLRGLQPGAYLYELSYVAMIFFFSYFWNTVQFQPKEMANQLRDFGSFIPGLRPGPRTADYLEKVMSRITYVGAAFLSLIAVIPSLVASFILSKGNMSEAYMISQFLGGTGLLIVISVMLDVVNRIEANLVMRDYGGFLEGGSSGGRTKRSPGGPVRGGPRQPQPASFSENGPKGLPA